MQLTSADDVKHGVDHSSTYSFSIKEWRNIVHIARLKKILSLIEASAQNRKSPSTFVDIGCSNGYITSIISEKFGFDRVQGFDYDEENLVEAKKRHPDIQFDRIDLNHVQKFPLQADVVTCFETLEHVGDIESALQNIANLTAPGGTAIISVPIETGFIGAVKYLAKVGIYKYDDLWELPGNPSKSEYFKKLLAGDIASYRRREPRREWGTHFGFDYAALEKLVAERFPDFRAFTYVTTRFIIFRKREPVEQNSGASVPQI